MGETGPDIPRLPDFSLPQTVCLKAMLRMVSGEDIQTAECPLRRGGYHGASVDLYGGQEVEVACVAKPDCPESAVLQIQEGSVTIVGTSL
jgi:hypothetical protein